MNKLIAALALTALLSGCASTREWCDEHPVACPMIVGAASTSLLMCVKGHSVHSQSGTSPAPEIPTPSVSCSNPQVCK